MNKTCSPNAMLPLQLGGAFMQSKAQRFRLGLLYGAIALLGAAYGVFEQPQAIDRLSNSMKQSLPLMKEMLPFSLLLILALVVYGLFRGACAVRPTYRGKLSSRRLAANPTNRARDPLPTAIVWPPTVTPPATRPTVSQNTIRMIT